MSVSLKQNESSFTSRASRLRRWKPLRVGVNFHRAEIGELGGGHMSPLGAYDEVTDRVLVMDVSRYKYPPVWTELTAAYTSMNTVDGASGMSRGWIVVTSNSDNGGGGGVAPTAPGEEAAAPATATAEEVRAGRAACMATAGDSDWDTVMGCMRWPIATGSGGGSTAGCDGSEVSTVAAVFAALVSAVAGGATVGAAWYYVERQRAAKFRRHTVMEGDFEDI